MKTLRTLALVLVIVGAVNWGLVGIAQFDLVAALFGGSSTVPSRAVYTLVGLAGVALAALQSAPSGSPALGRSGGVVASR